MNKQINFSWMMTVLRSRRGSVGISEDTAPIIYDTPQVREKLFPIFLNVLYEDASPEVKQQFNENIRQLGETPSKESILEIAHKYFVMPADFFEKMLPNALAGSLIVNRTLFFETLSKEEISFWWYLARLRYLMLCKFTGVFDDELAPMVQDMTAVVRENFLPQDPKECARILSEVVRYEKTHPYDFNSFVTQARREDGGTEQEAADYVAKNAEPARLFAVNAFERDIHLLQNMKEGESWEDAVKNENSQNGIMEYNLELTRHPFFPTENFFALVNLDEEKQNQREFPLQMSSGWGSGAEMVSHIADGMYPLPKSTDMVWYSPLENKCYSLEEELPTDKIKELFVQKDEDGDPLYTDLFFGLAPYGYAAVWTQNHQTLDFKQLAWLKGEETEVSYEDFARGFHLENGNNWQEYRENFLNAHPKSKEFLEKNGVLSPDLFPQFNQAYSQTVEIMFAVSPKGEAPFDPTAITIENIKIKYFNGETESGTPEVFEERQLRAKPKAVEIHYKEGDTEYSAYLYVDYQTAQDNQKIHEKYQSVFRDNPNQEGELSFVLLSDDNKPVWHVFLQVEDQQTEIPFEEILFRNKFEYYRTPVYYQPESFWKGSKPTEEEQESLPADINAVDENGNPLLVDAINKNDEKKIKALLEAGADVNVQSTDGDTPLSLAAMRNETALVKELLAKGARVNDANKNGQTPLMLASMSDNNAETVKILLEAGADVNKPLMMYGKETGENALTFAQNNNASEIISLLLEAGAVLPTPSAQPAAPQETPLPSADQVNTPDASGMTPLFQALMTGNTERVKDLLKLGADVHVKMPGIGTPLLFACSAGNVEATQALIDAGADVNVPNDTGLTPLMFACSTGNKALAEALIVAGADVNAQHVMNGQPTGMTPLKMAQGAGFAEIVSLLEAAGARD